MLLQHIEFEVYVNKDHIWLFEKKRNRCKTKCGYHTMTKLKIFEIFENLTFIKSNYICDILHNIYNIYNIYTYNIYVYIYIYIYIYI